MSDDATKSIQTGLLAGRKPPEINDQPSAHTYPLETHSKPGKRANSSLTIQPKAKEGNMAARLERLEEETTTLSHSLALLLVVVMLSV